MKIYQLKDETKPNIRSTELLINEIPYKTLKQWANRKSKLEDEVSNYFSLDCEDAIHDSAMYLFRDKKEIWHESDPTEIRLIRLFAFIYLLETTPYMLYKLSYIDSEIINSESVTHSDILIPSKFYAHFGSANTMPEIESDEPLRIEDISIEINLDLEETFGDMNIYQF